MRSRVLLTALLMAAAASPPALATQRDPARGGVQTETQRRVAQGEPGLPWDLIGLFGLIGLLGFASKHPDDSYHPAPLE